MKCRYVWIGLFLSGTGVEAQAVTYTAHEVASGIHVFVPSEMGLGNAVTIVDGGRALVVDGTGTPEAARTVVDHLREAGITELEGIVLTHWHDDHVWGTQTFAETFPGSPVFAHPATVRDFRERAVPALEGQIERLHTRILERDQQIRERRSGDGTPLTDSEIEALRARQTAFRQAVASLETVRPIHPDSEVETVRQVRVGTAVVTIEYLGRGHTAGDLVVAVPDRGLIVVGDLVTLPVPAAAEAFVADWIGVLDELLGRSWSVVVPGHGAATADRAYVTALVELMRATRDYVANGIESGTSLDDLVDHAAFSGFVEVHAPDVPSAEAMFVAFYVEPAIRALHEELTSR